MSLSAWTFSHHYDVICLLYVMRRHAGSLTFRENCGEGKLKKMNLSSSPNPFAGIFFSFFSFLFLFLFSFFLFYIFFLFSPVSVPMCLSVFVSLPSTVSFSISGCLNPAKKSEPIAPQSSGDVWMKVEVVVLGSPSLIGLTVSVDVKQHWTRTYCLFRENRDRAVELCEMMTCVELGWTLKKWDSWPQMAW